MPRHPNVSLKATNQILELIAISGGVGSVAATEAALSAQLGVSRVVARTVFQNLETAGILKRQGRQRVVARLPLQNDYYQTAQIESRVDSVARQFMQIAQNGSLLPGQHFTEAEIARNFKVSTVGIREFLIGFAKFGLVAKVANGGWRFCAFDEGFARELASLRTQFELDGIRVIAQLPTDDSAFREVEYLLQKHQSMRSDSAETIRSFSPLDREFHQSIISKLNNRFINSLYDVVSFVFHFHYQWRKDSELSRNAKAIDEHIAILEALRDRQFELALANMQTHLATSLRTLLHSAIK